MERGIENKENKDANKMPFEDNAKLTIFPSFHGNRSPSFRVRLSSF